MIIYLDILLLKEILINYLILFLHSKISNQKLQKLGSAFSIIISSLYTVLCIYDEKYFSIIYRILIVMVMVTLSFKHSTLKEIIRDIILYYMITFLLGGIFEYTKIETKLTMVYIFVCLSFVITTINDYKNKYRTSNYIVDLLVPTKKGMKKLKALVDTGHFLKTKDGEDIIVFTPSIYKKIKKENYEKIKIKYSTIGNIDEEVYGEKIKNIKIIHGTSIYDHEAIVIPSKGELLKYDAIISTYFLGLNKKERKSAMEILFLIMEKTKKFFTKVMTFIGFSEKNSMYYIGGAEVLPPPLLPNEEKEVLANIEKDKEGTRKILIERNLRLVVYIAKKFENTSVPLEDLVSIGTIGLVKAINTYDPSKNIKLATYASRCIENEILMYLRRTSKLKNEVSIDEPLNTDGDGNELLLSDIIGTEEDVIFKRLEQSVDNQLIKESIKKLNKREKIIMELRFGFISGKEKTQKEVADMLGISQSYISRLEKKIIAKIKKEMLAKI
ncbi:MAG: RNA polymerase sporulation sigma factor SigE [Clostridia bacterium]|nr:RNA polymerase sporulation sigma factor SigE [Clostridia bacterium]